ncbi:RNA-protein complex protein Nop10 [Candidatus Woesearchaeota archaeon]|nr:RNA-protein complex protein Nop10 [Candidatus Woesearchaeota archaeon]
MQHILKCRACGRYTLKEACPCGGEAVNPKPAKYSPEDHYAKYRREAKREDLERQGLV